MKRFIYSLKREQDGVIFYIGVTNDCRVRLISHKSTFGKDIAMDIIEEVDARDSLNREKHWIREFTKNGFVLDNRSGFELIPIKTIKVPDNVHRELKIYVANPANGTMEEVSGFAIMTYLKEKGHKFSPIYSKAQLKRLINNECPQKEK